MKIIHIVENLDKGAVENWLVNIFIESRKYRPEWDWTFFCIVGKEGRLDEKVRNAGGKIIYSPVTISKKISFLKNLRNVLHIGRFDIIHSHHDYLSGFYLLATAGIRFSKRFLHVHNTDKALPVGSRLLHRILLNPFKIFTMIFSDYVIGISENTLGEYVGFNRMSNKKYVLLYYGVDFGRFNTKQDGSTLKKELNLPQDGRILLFVGRMNDLKNPDYVIDVLYQLLKIRKDVYAVFVGKGDREIEVKARAEELQIQDHVRIPGWYDDIPSVMKSSDVFIFPRKEYPKEGLGLVVVEAQAAGLPMFITEGIVRDAIVINKLAHFNKLDNAAEWAKQISDVLDHQPVISSKEALEIMKQSKFELCNATKNLIHLYEG